MKIVQRGALQHYRDGFRELLERVVVFTGGQPAAALVLSIPDWSVTPFAEGRDRRRIASEIDAYNALNREETLRAGARYVDITSLSRLDGRDRSLLAEDGLHPSGRMYARWVELITPVALQALGVE